MQRLNWGTNGVVPQKGRGETSFYLPDVAGSQNTALGKWQELGEKEKRDFPSPSTKDLKVFFSQPFNRRADSGPRVAADVTGAVIVRSSLQLWV